MCGVLQHYPQNATGGRLLISGNCPAVKHAFLEYRLKDARKKNLAVVIIDYARTGDFSKFLMSNGYPIQYTYRAEQDNYEPLAESIREAICNLRFHAQKNGYSHAEYAMMTSFLDFLSRLEPAGNIMELLQKFRTQKKLEAVLTVQIRNRLITRQEAQDHLQTYLEYAKSGITADILLSELKFILTEDYGKPNFSLSSLRAGEAAVLYAERNHIRDKNNYLSEIWCRDILKLANRLPILLVINTGNCSQTEKIYELVETLRPDIPLIYFTYDLFSDIQPGQAEQFAKLFEINVYGAHTGTSAEYVSKMFPEHWISQYSYTKSRDPRILGESLLDRLLKTDYTPSVTVSPVKERCIPPEQIMSMSQREYILFDMIQNMFCLSGI